MAPSRDEQRKRNRERMARTRQSKADTTIPIDPQDELGSIEIVVPPDGPKLTLKDKLFGGTLKNPGAPAPAPAKRSSSKKEDNLISTVLPTIIATFIATYAQQILPEPYKLCAPSQQECNAIFSPLMAMIGRRVQVAAKVSQDVIDLTNSLLAGIGFGVRSYVTYVQITNKIVDSKGDSLEEKTSHPARKQRSIKQRSEEEDVRVSGSSEERIVESVEPIADSGDNVPDSGNGTTGDGEQEARAISYLLARDRRGREQLKLI